MSDGSFGWGGGLFTLALKQNVSIPIKMFALGARIWPKLFIIKPQRSLDGVFFSIFGFWNVAP